MHKTKIDLLEQKLKANPGTDLLPIEKDVKNLQLETKKDFERLSKMEQDIQVMKNQNPVSTWMTNLQRFRKETEFVHKELQAHWLPWYVIDTQNYGKICVLCILKWHFSNSCIFWVCCGTLQDVHQDVHHHHTCQKSMMVQDLARKKKFKYPFYTDYFCQACWRALSEPDSDDDIRNSDVESDGE
jgi:hypothetical protein